MKNNNIYLIIQNIRSLYNVGSIFRSADIFNIQKIYLTGYTGTPPRKEISKVALGAEKWVKWEKQYSTVKLINNLKQQKTKIYALETGVNTKNITNFKPLFPCAIIVGNEKNGIPKKIISLSDSIISIPMFGKKESLNVSIAASIAMYEINKHR